VKSRTEEREIGFCGAVRPDWLMIEGLPGVGLAWPEDQGAKRQHHGTAKTRNQ
jgi:hypothetical protein